MSATDLISIGSCLLHIIHGSFRKSLKSTTWLIDKSINDIWFRFSRSSARRQDFGAVANSIDERYSRFNNRFVEARWIEIGSVMGRVVEKWNIVNEYFLVYLRTIEKKWQEYEILENKMFNQWQIDTSQILFHCLSLSNNFEETNPLAVTRIITRTFASWWILQFVV